MDAIKEFDARIYIGGPVQQDTLHFIHRVPVLEDAIDIGNGLFWGGDFEQLTSLIETHQTNVLDVKFFLGYSGWSPGQLEEELKLDSWIVSDQVSDALVFETNPELMWKEAMRSLGGRFSVYSNYPEDPRMN
jgi:putative transcriptional regulator